MVQSWGYDGGSFAVLVLLTNACSLVTRLLLPAVALGLLLILGLQAPHVLVAPVVVGLAVFAAIATVALLALRPASDAPKPRRARASALLDRLVGPALLCARDRVRTDVRAIVRRSWLRFAFGMAGYATLQAALLWLCLLSTGANTSPFGAFAAYGVGSALSLIPFTPGGVGFAEAGTAAVLYGVGGNPASVAAAVLLYSAFTRWMEIPVGAATTAWWLTRTKMSRRAGTREITVDTTSAPAVAGSHAYASAEIAL